jgi:hypothetical protein
MCDESHLVVKIQREKREGERARGRHLLDLFT